MAVERALIETGDTLLLEDGDGILLESSSIENPSHTRRRMWGGDFYRSAAPAVWAWVVGLWRASW